MLILRHFNKVMKTTQKEKKKKKEKRAKLQKGIRIK
jgi:hypothetical protein